MIARTGRAPHQVHDYGPTPAPTRAKGSISGSIVVPASTRHRERIQVNTFDRNEWKRNKRASDPEWAQRQRDLDKAARERKA